MEVYQSEEEQIEAIKKWWGENGTSIILGIALALSVVFGWKYWQSEQVTANEGASTAYEAVVEAIEGAELAAKGSLEDSTVGHLGSKLLEDHDGTTYSHLTALLLAKYSVDKGDLEGAAIHLQWAADNTDDVSIRMVAKVRLAKVLLAQDKADDALVVLNSESVSAFEASIEELKGDIYLSQDDTEKARSAYQKAAAAADKDESPRQLLNLKLDDIAA